MADALLASAQAIVAAFDLKAVQAIRRAIAPPLSGPRGPLGTAPGPTPAPGQHPIRDGFSPAAPTVSPSPRFLPRPVHHPEPRIEPPAVIRPEPVVAPPVDRKLAPGPLPPPWKTPVWDQPIPPRPVIKLTVHRPDIRHKGMLFDALA